MSTANFYILAKPLQSDEGIEEPSRVLTPQLSVARPKAEIEPEERLWKICAEVNSPKLWRFEWIAFLFLGLLAFGALVCCSSELFHLLNTEALVETVRALLTR